MQEEKKCISVIDSWTQTESTAVSTTGVKIVCFGPVSFFQHKALGPGDLKKKTGHEEVVSLGNCEMELLFVNTQWSIWNNRTSEVVLNRSELVGFFPNLYTEQLKECELGEHLLHTCIISKPTIFCSRLKLQKLQAIIITCPKELEAGQLSSSIAAVVELRQQENASWWSTQSSPGSRGRSRGTLQHPSASTANSSCSVGKPCRQHNGGLGSAPWCEAGATRGPC